MKKLTRIRNAAGKLLWGTRVVGPLEAVRGLARLAALRVRRPATAEVVLRRSGIRLTYAYPGQLVPVLVVFGDVIDPEYAFLRRVSRPDWTYVDVGAAIGQFTSYAAHLGASRVHAFEPSGENVARLRENVERNGFADRVSVHQCALADKPGEAVFATQTVTYVSGLTEATGTAGDAGGAGEAGEAGERVRVDTLAEACDRLGLTQVSVLKVNVAGAEPAVLEGAEPLLARGGADVLVLLVGLESLPRYERLRDHGYGFYFYDPRAARLRPVDRFDPEGFFAARPGHSPARHVIAIHRNALARCTDGGSVTVG